KNQRIILIETLTVSDGSATDVATVRYQYSNHLGSACLELDENGQIISYEEYHPFGTTSYRSGRSEIEVSLKRYKYVGKERDEETGLYYYGARYYAAWLCRFVSVDSLQFEYPELTPYQYASNRPVTGIDLDGREVYITGEAAAAYYAEVQKGAATLGISTSIDEKGKLSATYSGEGEISANGQQLLDAINSTDIHIKINATNEDYTDDGRIFFGGAFMGNELINKKIGKDDFLIPEVNAFQTVNPGDLKTIDEYYDKPGQTSLHELTEAYQGGLLSQKNGIASPSSNILGTVYQQAHDTAIPQSGEIIPYYFDIKGEQIKVSRRSLYSIGYALPGKESLIKEVFLKSK
ncbi:MAG: hypothetical protein LBL18_01930, partial [Bacteroidales bacterium]|nr:hypothetical protein [Bacteroidales bacterium]